MLTDSYYLWPIIGLLLALRVVLYYLRSKGRLKLAQELRFWNWILLWSSLVMGILGLLLTAKLERGEAGNPQVYQFIYWLHIEAGIVMSVVAAMHVIFHRRYYFPLKKR